MLHAMMNVHTYTHTYYTKWSFALGVTKTKQPQWENTVKSEKRSKRDVLPGNTRGAGVMED